MFYSTDTIIGIWNCDDELFDKLEIPVVSLPVSNDSRLTPAIKSSKFRAESWDLDRMQVFGLGSLVFD